MGPRCVSPGPVCDPPCTEEQTCEEVPDVGPTCVPPEPETCTPVEQCVDDTCTDVEPFGVCMTSLSSGDIMCVDGPSPNCDPGYVCDPQPEGDPACVMHCVDPHGDDVLCLPGEICMDGTYCLDPSAGGPE